VTQSGVAAKLLRPFRYTMKCATEERLVGMVALFELFILILNAHVLTGKTRRPTAPSSPYHRRPR
jgi:hypothetical protein